MGYTIAAHAKSEKAVRQMVKFMENHYRPASDVLSLNGDYSRFACNVDDEELSYDSAKLAIGFDFNACDPERDYIFAITRWMALKIGRRVSKKELGSVPVYFYDQGVDEEGAWPILLEDEWEKSVPKIINGVWYKRMVFDRFHIGIGTCLLS